MLATIPPVHSLAAMVMEGAGSPDLLLNGSETPHSASLRPSQSRLLASADIVVRVGDTLEGFLQKPLRALSGRARIVSLTALPGTVKLKLRDHRENGHGHGHDHGHSHGHNDRSGPEAAIDPHVWLHTGNAIVAINAVARELSRIDPDNAPVYTGNAGRATIRLRALKLELDRTVDPVRKYPFVVFHDAWQYFSAEFGLKMAGALSIDPERKPGARRMTEIRTRIRTSGARCIFAEPQFSPALIRTVMRGTPVRFGVLDPLGASLTRGPDLYPTLMRNLARDIASCLKAGNR